MLNAQRLAQLIKLMLATGLAFTAGKQAIGKFLAVIGQQLLNFDRASLVQRFAQLHKNGFLRGIPCGLQSVWGVGLAVLRT